MRPYLASLFLVALAMAQDLSGLPSCAAPGATSAIASSGCATTDIACICKSTYFTNGLEQYAKAHCGLQDYNTVIAMGQSVCASAGVTLSGATSTTMTGTMTASSGSNTSNATGSVTTTTTTAAVDATASMASDVGVSCTMCCNTPSITVPAAIATYSGAAARPGRARGGVADLIAGAVALVGFIGL